MTTLRVSSPAELISVVPFLVGFHPADSLTVVAMQGPKVTFAVRVDLPERDTPEVEARAAVLHLASVVLRQQVEAVTIIGYGDEPRATPAVLRISHAFRKAGLTIVDELRVAEGRYWSYLCTDLSCCPEEGQPCEPPHSLLAAEATFAGAVALPSREALAAQLAPATGDDREAMIAATARAGLRLAALAADHPPAPATPSSPGARTDRAAEHSSGVASSGDGEHPPAAVADGALSDPEPGTIEERPEPVMGSNDPRLAQALWDSRGPYTDLSESRPAEWRRGRAIWAQLSLSSAGPAEGDCDRRGLGLVPDEDQFFARVRREGREAVRAAERRYRSGGRLTDEQAAWLGVLLLHVPVRDYAWTRTRTHDWEIALWSDLTRRVEPRYVPAPAALLAFVSWRAGMGALASVAVERALEQKPDYSLAVVLQDAIRIGLPPASMDGWPAINGIGPDGDGDPEQVATEPAGGAGIAAAGVAAGGAAGGAVRPATPTPPGVAYGHGSGTAGEVTSKAAGDADRGEVVDDPGRRAGTPRASSRQPTRKGPDKRAGRQRNPRRATQRRI